MARRKKKAGPYLKPYSKVQRALRFRLKDIRTEMGFLLVKDLYEYLDCEIPYTTLTRFMAGQKFPDVEQLLVICGKLGITAEQAIEVIPPLTCKSRKLRELANANLR